MKFIDSKFIDYRKIKRANEKCYLKSIGLVQSAIVLFIVYIKIVDAGIMSLVHDESSFVWLDSVNLAIYFLKKGLKETLKCACIASHRLDQFVNVLLELFIVYIEW